MKKKDLFLALSLASLVLFAAVLLLAVAEVINVNVLYSLVFLVVSAVFILLHIKEKNGAQAEADFVSTERSRTYEKPQYIRDFEIVKDCFENIVTILKEDRNIVGITLAKNSDDFDGYYETEIDTFEFLDCLYFQTDEEIDSVSPDVLAILEDAFLTRKFLEVDARFIKDNVVFFKRDEETFYETFYVYSENPDAFSDGGFEVERLGGCWYYVKSNKNITELLNI